MYPYYQEIHTAIFVFAVIGVGCWALIAKRYKSLSLFIATSLWLLNIITFSIFRLCDYQMDIATLNAWSLGIRLQGVLTVSGAGLALLFGWKLSDGR